MNEQDGTSIGILNKQREFEILAGFDADDNWCRCGHCPAETPLEKQVCCWGHALRCTDEDLLEDMKRPTDDEYHDEALGLFTQTEIPPTFEACLPKAKRMVCYRKVGRPSLLPNA